MCRAQCVLVVALFFGLVHSWDIAISARDRIEFYAEDGNKTGTVRFNYQNLSALVYDEVHNMLLYIEKQKGNDTICGYDLTSMEYKCYIQRNGRNIHGLAFEPATETLFFTDTKERSINSFSLKPRSTNNIYGNLLVKMDEGIPTDIAVDSCRGYIYWINTNLTKSTIERARLNGSDREVVINAMYKLDLHSLAIDQLTQKVYWFMPETESHAKIYSADLNGNNSKSLMRYKYSGNCSKSYDRPNTITVSKKNLWLVDWCAHSSAYFRDLPKQEPHISARIIQVHNASFIGITAKYRIKEQFQGISDCSHIPVNNENNDSTKIAKEYKGPFCVHGIEVRGQSHCKCTPRYIGERCDVKVCENYCFHGNCSLTEDELPECRCNAGYSGKRCEMNVCDGYCLNLGTCSLNGDSEPVCQCKRSYLGNRCELSACETHCLQGKCSFTEEGIPKCSCNAGYSGERCEVNVCNGYCLQGNCSFTEEGIPICSCNAGYSGERCEVNVCNGYCLNLGTCSLNEEDDPVCECVGAYEGQRCEVALGLGNVEGSPNEVVKPGCQCVGSYGGTSDIADNNTTISNYQIIKGNVKISVVVEVK